MAILDLYRYIALRPVNELFALMALLFNIMDTAIETVNGVLCNFGALFFAKSIGHQDLAAPLLRLHEYGFGAGLLFFGVFLVLLGFLMTKSSYFPRWLGIFAMIGGACYAINSYSVFAAPAVEDAIYPFILLPPLIAELSIAFWLIIKGINPLASDMGG